MAFFGFLISRIKISKIDTTYKAEEFIPEMGFVQVTVDKREDFTIYTTDEGDKYSFEVSRRPQWKKLDRGSGRWTDCL